MNSPDGFDAVFPTGEALARIAAVAAAGGRLSFWPSGECPLAHRCPRLQAAEELAGLQVRYGGCRTGLIRRGER